MAIVGWKKFEKIINQEGRLLGTRYSRIYNKFTCKFLRKHTETINWLITT